MKRVTLVTVSKHAVYLDSLFVRIFIAMRKGNLVKRKHSPQVSCLIKVTLQVLTEKLWILALMCYINTSLLMSFLIGIDFLFGTCLLRRMAWADCVIKSVEFRFSVTFNQNSDNCLIIIDN